MRIAITFHFQNQELSIFYRYHLQGLIFGYLRSSHKVLAALLHNIGFPYNGRARFKFFCFSGLVFETPLKLPKGREHFWIRNMTAKLYISSAMDDFIKHLLFGLFKKGEFIRIGRSKGRVLEVAVLEPIQAESEMVLKPVFSPIVMKLYKRNEKGRLFLESDDKEFGIKLKENLIKKYEIFYQEPPENKHLDFEFLEHRTAPVPIKKKLEDGSWYRGESIGNIGKFRVKGSRELIQMGLDCGFGSQNSMGCGFCDVVKME